MIQRLSVVVMALSLTLVAVAPVHAADEVSDGQWFHRFLKTDQAHAITKGAGVTVAVIDSGIDSSHPDLRGSVLPGNDLTSPTGGDGHTDRDGHGTGMAGLIAAHGRVKGVAPASKVIPVRTSDVGEGLGSKLALGIRWATSNGADVISISLGAPSHDLLLQQEIDKALRADIVVVAGVGNKPEFASVAYPAAIAGVVAVAGVDSNGNHSSVSVTGREVTIAAPSDNISTTDKGGKYRIRTGTSDATAIVAGAVALIRSKYPDLSATEVVRRLTATAIDKGDPGRDNQYGYGVLNLVAALTADLPAATPSTTKLAAKTTTAPTPAPPSDRGGFPWWLIAVLPIVAVAIALLIWLRQRRT